jgi:hypothetical protein
LVPDVPCKKNVLSQTQDIKILCFQFKILFHSVVDKTKTLYSWLTKNPLDKMTLDHKNLIYIECSSELVHILDAKTVALESSSKTGAT